MVYSITNFEVSNVFGINLLCEHWKWSVVLGSWAFNGCELTNDEPQHSSMIWIGEHDKSSLNWTNYTIRSTIILNDNIGNGGIAFHIQNVNASIDGGTYYALNLFANDHRVDFSKFDNGFRLLDVCTHASAKYMLYIHYTILIYRVSIVILSLILENRIQLKLHAHPLINIHLKLMIKHLVPFLMI